MLELTFTDEASARRERVRVSDPSLSLVLERRLSDLAAGTLFSQAYRGGRRVTVFGVPGRDTEYLIVWRLAEPATPAEVLVIVERPR